MKKALRDFYPISILMLAVLVNQVQARDKADGNALTQTQELLRDSKQRDQAIQQSAEEKKVDANITQFTGGSQKTKDEIYGLSAEVLANFSDANGEVDMDKLNAALKENPDAFVKNNIKPEQAARIRSIANDVETNTRPKP